MSTTTSESNGVDARAPRFTATVTATVLVAVLVFALFSVPAATTLLAFQSAVFAVGALGGPQRHPYASIYRVAVAPRLGPPVKREPLPPLRFAQLMGFITTMVGVVGFALGNPAVGVAATGVALFVAFVRAAFGICLSRKLFMLIAHLRGGVRPCCRDQ